MKHVYWGSNGGVGKPYPQPSGSPMNLYQGGQAAAFNNPNFNTPNYSVSQLSMQHMMVPQPMGPQPMGPQPMGPQPMGPQPMGPQPMGPQPMGPQPMGPPISPQLSALVSNLLFTSLFIHSHILFAECVVIMIVVACNMLACVWITYMLTVSSV